MYIETEKVWQEANAMLRVRIGEEKHKEWFSNLRLEKPPSSVEMCLSVSSKFLANWLNEYFLKDIEACVQERSGSRITSVRIVMRPIAKAKLGEKIDNSERDYRLPRSGVKLKVPLSEEGTSRRSKALPSLEDIRRKISESRPLTARDIFIIVSHISKQPFDEITKVSRGKDAALRARVLAVYSARELTTESLESIGRQCGGRVHAGVHNALRRAKALLAKDEQFLHDAEEVFAFCNRELQL